MRTKTEVFFIASISFLAACAALLPAISQDQSYHAFADRRSWGFIPNAQDTLTNLAFVIASTWGAWRLVSGSLLLPGPWMRLPLVVFLAGVALIGYNTRQSYALGVQPIQHRMHWSPSA